MKNKIFLKNALGFSYHSDVVTFITIWGNKEGRSLWEVFCMADYDPAKLVDVLSDDQIKKLNKYLKK